MSTKQSSKVQSEPLNNNRTNANTSNNNGRSRAASSTGDNNGRYMNSDTATNAARYSSKYKNTNYELNNTDFDNIPRDSRSKRGKKDQPTKVNYEYANYGYNGEADFQNNPINDNENKPVKRRETKRKSKAKRTSRSTTNQNTEYNYNNATRSNNTRNTNNDNAATGKSYYAKSSQRYRNANADYENEAGDQYANGRIRKPPSTSPYTYKYSAIEGQEIEEAFMLIIDKVISFETQRNRARFHTLQSILEKIVRFNAAFYANFVHGYITSAPDAWKRVIMLLVAKIQWSDGEADVRNQFLGFDTLKRIADDMILKRMLDRKDGSLRTR